MVLYKYLSADTLTKVLKNKCVLFNNTHEWNDPFEMSVFDYEHVEPIFSVFEHIDIYRKFSQGLVTEEDLLKHKEKHLFTESTNKRIIENNIVAYSLAEDWNNLLMWAHYADEHKGCVIEYEFNDNLFKTNKFLYKIKYDEIRCQKNIMENSHFLCDLIENIPNGINDEIKDDLLNYSKKSNNWKYEEEWRIICLKKDADLTDKKTGRCFFKIPTNTIKSIYFGNRINRSNANTIYSIIKNDNDYDNVVLYQVYLEKFMFKLNSQPFDITKWFTGFEEEICFNNKLSSFNNFFFSTLQRSSIFYKLKDETLKSLMSGLSSTINEKWNIRYKISNKDS